MSSISTNLAEHVENLRNLSRAKAFLGKEFLTWLWYLVETSEGIIKGLKDPSTGEGLNVNAWIDDRVVLEQNTAETHTMTLKGGNPAHSIEVAASLRTGKNVREFRLGLEINGMSAFRALLNSDGISGNGLSPKSLELPEQIDENFAKGDEHEVIRLRMVKLFLSVLDGLFLNFMKQRLDQNWEKTELQKVRTWLRSRQLEEKSSVH